MGAGELSKSQIAVYGAIAVVLLLVGGRAIRAGGAGGDGTAQAARPQGSSAGSGLSIATKGGDVVVDVAGAVRRPGVYSLPAGARVNDAVKRAGGAAGGAQLDAVNLAAVLADGQQIVVPKAGTAGGGAAGAAAADGPIGLGTATAEQLDTIDGIGPVTARKILEFRDQHGGLSSIDQLNQVSGIGPATMQSLRARLQP